MKIAMLTNNYRPFVGGVPVSVERQVRHLAALGHEVTVFAPEYGNTEEEDKKSPERVVRYCSAEKKMENGMVVPCVWPTEVFRVFAQEFFDVIHVHHPVFAGIWGLYLGKKYNIPVVYTYHTRYEEYVHYIPCLRLREHSVGLKKKLVEWIRRDKIPSYIRWFADKCDFVICPSQSMQRVLEGYGMQTESAVLPTGIESEFFHVSEKKAEDIRRRLGKGKRYFLVTVSRLEEEKNYGFLLRGLWELKNRIGDDFQVLVIGDGRQKEELQARATFLGIRDQITFSGSIPNEEINVYVKAADVFLFASKSETQGIVLAEAMAAGTPAVAVRAGGVEDIVRDGINGFMTEEKEDVWAEQVIHALNPEVNARLSRQARADARKYDASALAIREGMLYNQCVRKKQEGRAASGYEEKECVEEHSAVAVR